MKKQSLLIFSFCIIFLFSCGRDGNNGIAFVGLDWVFAPLSYSDSNASMPSSPQPGQHYLTAPGVYSFSYTAWDSSNWSGSYTVVYLQGEKSRFFEDGKDGGTGYYTVWLYSFGPEVDYIIVGGVMRSHDAEPGERQASCKTENGIETCTQDVINGKTMIHLEFHKN